MIDQESSPEMVLAQHGWKRIQENVQEAKNATRVIEVDVGDGKSATFYTEDANTVVPEGIAVIEDAQLERAA